MVGLLRHVVGEGAVVPFEAHLALLIVGQVRPLRVGLLLLGEVDLLVSIPELIPDPVPLQSPAAIVGV